MSLLRLPSKYATYKPMKYDWAYNAQVLGRKLHWLADEIPLGDDVKDYNKLPEKQKTLVRNILRLFTQNDVEALTGYIETLKIIKPIEVRMLLAVELDMEVCHIDAYSLLTDTLGFGEEFYNEFLEIPVMERKIDYLEKAKIKTFYEYIKTGLSEIEADYKFRQDVLRMVAIYAAGLEGIELMAQFMQLLALSEIGLFKGMTQINTYSVRDENFHCENNSKLFLELKKENADVYTQELENDIINGIKQIVEQEKAMTDYLYKTGEHPTITKEQSFQYIEFMANRALSLLELPLQYEVTKNPVPFMDNILASVEFANFFEVEATAYSRSPISGDVSKLRHRSPKFIKD